MSEKSTHSTALNIISAVNCGIQDYSPQSEPDISLEASLAAMVATGTRYLDCSVGVCQTWRRQSLLVMMCLFYYINTVTKYDRLPMALAVESGTMKHQAMRLTE